MATAASGAALKTLCWFGMPGHILTGKRGLIVALDVAKMSQAFQRKNTELGSQRHAAN